MAGDRPDVAQGHDAAGQPLPTWEMDVAGMGCGDVWSPAGDVLAWLDAVEDGRLLSARSRALMLTEQAATGKGPRAAGYGYGVFVGRHNGQRWWFHDGHSAGFIAFAANIPGLRRRIVVLSNTEATDAAALEPFLDQ
jgi:CubicO group peptidase (beta-lactamase class C family)